MAEGLLPAASLGMDPQEGPAAAVGASEKPAAPELTTPAPDAAADEVLATSLEEVKTYNIPELAKDKLGSRLLQRALAKGDPEVIKLICSKVEPGFLELALDQFGNYLAQKVLEACDLEQFRRLFAQLVGQLKELSEDLHGTRALQKVVEQATGRGLVSELAAATFTQELVGSMALHSTGFHVVNKLVECLPAKELEQLLEVLFGSPERTLAIGADRWGCCVMKKCLDRAEGAARQRVVDSILDSVLALVQDPYGNYVVQHLISTGHPRPTSSPGRVVDAMRGQIFDLCLQKFSSNVLQKLLQICGERDRSKIVNELLSPPGREPSEAVQTLLFHQFGNYVFQQALEVSKEPQFSLLIEHSRKHIQDAVKSEKAEGALPKGSLAAEHVKRLSLKLVKKYPALAEGLDMEHCANVWGQPYDPYTASFGADAFGAWAADPALAAAFFGALSGFGDGGFGPYSLAQTPSRKAGGKAARLAQKGGKQADAAAQEGAGSGDVLRVGRVVGHWPNYQVVYDEYPMQGDWKSHGGRSKNKAKGSSNSKAAQKGKAAAKPADAEEVATGT